MSVKIKKETNINDLRSVVTSYYHTKGHVKG